MVWLWLVEVFNHFDLAHAGLTQTERESNKKGARKSRMSRYTTLSLHFWVNLSADVFGWFKNITCGLTSIPYWCGWHEQDNASAITKDLFHESRAHNSFLLALLATTWQPTKSSEANEISKEIPLDSQSSEAYILYSNHLIPSFTHSIRLFDDKMRIDPK